MPGPEMNAGLNAGPVQLCAGGSGGAGPGFWGNFPTPVRMLGVAVEAETGARWGGGLWWEEGSVPSKYINVSRQAAAN